VFTIVLTLFTAITGWALRPPVMIPLTMNNTHPLPGTVLASDNAWYDCLRMIRYDEQNHIKGLLLLILADIKATTHHHCTARQRDGADGMAT